MLKLKIGSNTGSDTLTRDPTWPDQNRSPSDPVPSLWWRHTDDDDDDGVYKDSSSQGSASAAHCHAAVCAYSRLYLVV